MEGIQNLFKETISKFTENGLDDELNYSEYDSRTRKRRIAETDTAASSGGRLYGGIPRCDPLSYT